MSIAKDPNNKISITPQNSGMPGGLWFFNSEFGGFDIYNFVFTTKDQINNQISRLKWLHILKRVYSGWKKRAFESYNNIKIDRPDLDKDNADMYLVMVTEKITSLDGIYKNNFQVSDVFPLSTAVFEGHTFPVPNKSKAVLAKHYGDSFNDLPDDFGYSHHLDSW